MLLVTPMSLDVGRYRLYSAHKALQERWDQTRLYWQDVVRQEFAKEYFAALEPCVVTALAAIDRLAQVLIRARNDCG